MACELHKNKTLKAFHFALVESLERTDFFYFVLSYARSVCFYCKFYVCDCTL